MRIGFLITARLKSTRLPLKLMLELNGRTLIERVIDRAKKVGGCDEVVLCTSTVNQDRPLLTIARAAGIDYFSGSPDDVLDRLRAAAELFGLDYIIGATADNPMFSIHHARLLSDMVRARPGIDFASTTGLPLGTNVYAIRTLALQTVCAVKDSVETEIWGYWLRQPDLFHVEEVEVDPPFRRDYRMTLDEPDDHRFFLELFHRFAPAETVDLLDAYRVLDADSALARINDGVTQRDVDEATKMRIATIFEDEKERVLQAKRKIYGGS